MGALCDIVVMSEQLATIHQNRKDAIRPIRRPISLKSTSCIYGGSWVEFCKLHQLLMLSHWRMLMFILSLCVCEADRVGFLQALLIIYLEITMSLRCQRPIQSMSFVQCR